jgi:uncharacterized protein DUF2786
MDIDDSIVKRVRKLLALAASDSGATEAEASLAASKAAEIMEEYGLSIMQMEESGQETEGRDKDLFQAERAHWHDVLIAAVAESCFVYAETRKRRNVHLREFTLIGRKSAATTARITYEYLVKAILRTYKESGAESRQLFATGAAERLAERLKKRHADKLAEQKAEAEAKVREAHERAAANGSSTSTAIALTLVDYEAHERDLNEDFRNGYPPGTTEKRRRERDAATAAKEAKRAELRLSGIDDGVAWNMAFLNMDRERAEAYEKEWNKKQNRSKRRSEWTQADERAWRSEERRQRQRESASFRAGRSAGEKIGLEPQIDRSNQKLVK